MARILLLALTVWGSLSAETYSQDESLFHRIVTESPDALRDLFRFDGSSLPLVSAHRGGAVRGYPENCIATFEHTLRNTFSILEVDLQYTKDGQIVLLHDATLDRTTTGTGPVADRTLRELKELQLKDRDDQTPGV